MCNLVCNELENGGPLYVVGEDEAENNDDEFNTQPSLFLPRQQRIPHDANECKLSGSFW